MRPHGQYRIETRQRVLLVDATGPFNDRLIRDYLEELTANVLALEPAPWVMQVVVRDLSLFTPEAEQELMAASLLQQARGLRAVAIVLVEIVGETIVKAQMRRICGVMGLEPEFFEQPTQARDWLATQGFASD